MSDSAQPKPFKESIWSKIVDRVEGAYDKFVRVMSAPSQESKEAWNTPIRVESAPSEKKGVITMAEPATVITLKERADHLWEERRAYYAAMPRSEPLFSGEAHGEVLNDSTLTGRLGSRGAEEILADVSRTARESASVYWGRMADAGERARPQQADLTQTQSSGLHR